MKLGNVAARGFLSKFRRLKNEHDFVEHMRQYIDSMDIMYTTEMMRQWQIA